MAGKVSLSTTVDEIATPVEEIRSLDNTINIEVEVLLLNTADDVTKTTDDAEGKAPLLENVEKMITPTVEFCPPNTPLEVGNKLCMVEVTVDVFETSFEVDDNAKVPSTCVTDEEASTVALLTASNDCTELSGLRDDDPKPLDWVKVPLGLVLPELEESTTV